VSFGTVTNLPGIRVGVKVCLLTGSLDGLRSAIAEVLAQAVGRHNAKLEQAVLVADWVY
jgi:hypothetical protein